MTIYLKIGEGENTGDSDKQPELAVAEVWQSGERDLPSLSHSE